MVAFQDSSEGISSLDQVDNVHNKVWHSLLLFNGDYYLNCIYSHNRKFSYGYASSPGKRSSMEDFYETRIDGVDGEVVGLFGVFDGIFLSSSLLHLLVVHWLENMPKYCT